MSFQRSQRPLHVANISQSTQNASVGEPPKTFKLALICLSRTFY